MQNKWSRLILRVIIGLIVAVGFLFFLITNRQFINQSLSPITSSMATVDNLLSLPFRWGKNLSDSLNDLLRTYEENGKLKASLSTLSDQKEELLAVKSENEQLRKTLEMQEKVSSQQKITTEVITRSPLLWWDELTLNAGQDKQVKTQMLAVSEKGLIGKIVDVNQSSSKLSLLTRQNEVLAIPVKWTNQEKVIYGLLSGYDQNEGLLLISDINSSDDFKPEGDVVTSGLDGETVADIPVGQLIAVDNKTRTAKVKPWADFSNLSVIILVGR
ncbi:rod shape-determining protein MreC [Streptococcus sp. sy010]|uniref:rod shape-determining protein MreC n=1 Tax=Streptococcus sp. sy010 TaxID=2600148 RepID=UPI0011B4CE73|nr:rod shape-determining protein MreC [Streptococcus sp. sy010]TWT16153.1 rod shape-determining protein MreC [Streptococcus sp. sy010]